MYVLIGVSALSERFDAGAFATFWRLELFAYHELKGIDWNPAMLQRPCGFIA